MLTTAALIFVVSRILVPELQPGETVDLRAHLIQVRMPFFLVLSLACLFPVLRGFLVEDGPFLNLMNVARVFVLIFAVSGVFIKRPGWLVWLAVLWGVPLVGGLLLHWGALKY